MKIYRKTAQNLEQEAKRKRKVIMDIYNYFAEHGYVLNTMGGKINSAEKTDEAMGTCYTQIVAPNESHIDSFYVEKYYEEEYYQDRWGRKTTIPVDYNNPMETIARIEKVIDMWNKAV